MGRKATSKSKNHAQERPFKGIQRGDMVKFSKRVDGVASEPRVFTRKVNTMLIFDTHVVVNFGFCGTVVDDSNYISHRPSRKVASPS